MVIYIFKSMACMVIFFAFYKFLLENEDMHVFKRFYLLSAIGASLFIPALVFTEYIAVAPANLVENQQPITTNLDYVGVPASLEKDVLDFEPILWTVYFLGLVFFGLKFIRNLFRIIRRIRQNPKQKSASFIQVLVQEHFPPHTFFNYIFLNKNKFESNEIPKEVLLHEETHAEQKHSCDVIFIEFFQVIFWFNPLVYLFKKAIKLNHEFLADKAVLDKNIDKITYQNTLLSYLSPDSQNKYQSKMANAINYSSIKKRFTVMKTHTSKKAMLLRSSLLLPLLALLLLGFSETKLIKVTPKKTSEVIIKASQQELEHYNTIAKKYNSVTIEKRQIPFDDIRILETIFGKMDENQKANSQPFPECLPENLQDGASKMLIEEYNKLAKSHNLFSDFNLRPRESEIKRLTHIYGLMTVAQKNRSELFPKYPTAQDGASRKLMAEYNTLAKFYNDMPRNTMKIKKKDVDRLEYIYSLMSDKQKADAEPFPDFPKPPPPPKAPKPLKDAKPPKVKKGKKSDIPPPPSPDLSDVEFADKVIEEVIANQDPHDRPDLYLRSNSEVVKTPALSVSSRTMETKKDIISQPPTPPDPQTPLDHVVEMAKKDAVFYYEGKEISSDTAIELLKKNKALNIDSHGSRTKRPIVKISKAPIVIED